MPAAFLSGLLLAGRRRLPGVVALLFCLWTAATHAVGAEGRWWSDAAEHTLSVAGTNRTELLRALHEVPVAQRDGIDFLLQHMPEPDARRLTASYLLENVDLAFRALAGAPWAAQVPRAIFLNDVLPYACLNEPREDWRRLLYEKGAPVISGCLTPGAAAHRLNQTLFKELKVRYSTQRRRADQGPLETIESGMATCTGLSILLVDACRAVGIPARVAATPMWSNNRGNHTWVEIWDGGWHFAGAAEPDGQGLDRGWFVGDASRAQKDVAEHAIYASSFARTGLSFPLVWAPEVAWVSAENVTDRYTARSKPAPTNLVLFQVKVLDRPGGRRVAAKVQVTDVAEPTRRFEGLSRNESVDLNDILPFSLPRGRVYSVEVEQGERRWRRDFQPGTNRQELLVLALSEPTEPLLPSQACLLPPRAAPALSPKDTARLTKAVDGFFAAETNRQATWKFSGGLDRLLAANEAAVRRAVWERFQSSPARQAAREDFATNQVRFGSYRSAYTVKNVGQRPAGGWPLFIALHGGGGAPKAVNDSQWQIMQRYYRDHPELGGYRYVALRAPNDTWNGFYDTYVYPLIERLIGQFLQFGDVDPNKVFVLGYSHGGYGAFAIGPKMPDRFAAIHASAAAPTDGETTPVTLRNTVFTAMVGENDTQYGRHDRNQKFRAAVEQLRGGRADIYPVQVTIVAGHGHSGLPDRDQIVSMYPAVRDPVPRELSWLQTDKAVRDFFWLHTPNPAKGVFLQASCQTNVLVVTATNATSVSIHLDSRLVDFARPIALEINGRREKAMRRRPSLKTLCESMQRRGDPELAFVDRLDLSLAAMKAANAK